MSLIIFALIFACANAKVEVVIDTTSAGGECEYIEAEPYQLDPTSNREKMRDLNPNLDRLLFGCYIPAYKIQWFNGNWSNWYVTGYNNIAVKGDSINGKITPKRVWAYFYNHTHA